MKLAIRYPSLVLTAAALVASAAIAGPFSSGSTGADGALAPTANTVVQLPPNGVLNYTTVTIPAGVTVTFAKNAANTPVTMLATGDVVIAGTIDIRGGASPTTRAGAGVTNGMPGAGGPGGFDGGRGGLPGPVSTGGNGGGPGGGYGGITPAGQSYPAGGGGAGFNQAGEQAYRYNNPAGWGGGPGVGYGSNGMLPAIGGSGGGGGTGGLNTWSLPGGGGGGGGGALMLVASGTVTISGAIRANGGAAGNVNNGDCAYNNQDGGGGGGGGSGGFVRAIAPSIAGSGNIAVDAGPGGCRTGNGAAGSNQDSWNSGGRGATGRLHVETVTKGSFDVAAVPTLTITAIGGVPIAANAGDISLPLALGNPLQVDIAASGIPVGTVVKLTLTQPYGNPANVNASALAGTLQASTASGSISIPSGATSLIASTTYSLTIAQGEALKVYAGGERVNKVELASALGGGMQVTLITVSGKEFVVPAAVLSTAQIVLG